MKEFIDGNTAIARAALDAGCDFFAGYPITPATSILLYMTRELPKVGGIAIQAEDEIASMGFCIGAAMTGKRVLTATSGPGISLYSENIGLAIMGEVPLVIVDVQRMGPATGAATTGAQGDIQFLRWGTSGGFPVIVLSPTGVVDSYNLTLRAFDLAERFRTPVFIATDKETSLTRATVDTREYERIPVRERQLAPAGINFVPGEIAAPTDIPPMSPFGGVHLLRFNTSSHDDYGYITKDPDHLQKLNEHLTAKIEDHVDEITLVKENFQAGADTLIISYGIVARSMDVAVKELRTAGQKVSALTIYSLWPLPEKTIRSALNGICRVIVPELNNGQYGREIERLTSDEQKVIGLNKIDGTLISPQEIAGKMAHKNNE
jgi:2-oxoglutarate/2-oxoacid ferredoxin oxidoreductase subunit alpha